MEKRRIIITGEDQIPIIEGQCPRCKCGDNSLIIYQNMKNPSVLAREKYNNILFVQCIACMTKYKTDLNSLINERNM